MLAEERRLFYVAMTRARQRLIVTAVASPEADGEQPSRFIDELSLQPTHLPGRPARSMSLAGVVAELRRVSSDPAESTSMRQAAAARLAGLAAETVGRDERLVPAADPSTWWGRRRRTTNDTPVRPRDEPLRLSASALGGLLTCPLRWFLSREAAGESARSSSLGFGSVIHALAEHMSTEHVDEAGLIELLDSVWDQLQFDSPWIAAREHDAAVDALRRFVRWHNGRPGRTYLGAEEEFDVTIGLDNGDQVALAGRVDRVELDADGRVVVVDFKTGKNAPTEASVREDPQLGLYQLAVDEGGFAERCGGAPSGGAELVQLRVDKDGMPKVQQQPPQTPDPGGRRAIEVQLAEGSAVVRREEFAASANAHCTRCEFAPSCPAQQCVGTVLS
jgi:RecB family exonuclease